MIGINGQSLFGVLWGSTALVIASNAPAWMRLAGKIAHFFIGDYVGVCDGIADDAEIQAAVSALPSGGKIFLSTGQFRISATVNITSGIILEGQIAPTDSGDPIYYGIGTSLGLSADVDMFNIIGAPGSERKWIQFRNLVLDAESFNPYSAHTNNNGINAQHAFNVYLEKVTIRAFRYGINFISDVGLWWLTNVNFVACGSNGGASIFCSGSISDFHMNGGGFFYPYNYGVEFNALGGVFFFNGIRVEGHAGGGGLYYCLAWLHGNAESTYIEMSHYVQIRKVLDITNANPSRIHFVNNIVQLTSETPLVFASTSADNYIALNEITTDAAYTIDLGDSSYNRILANQLSKPIIGTAGAGNVIGFNKGYVTENSGTATVLNTTTSIVVNHGLAATPTRVLISLTNNPTNDPQVYWVDTLTSTQFTINTRVDPGITGAVFNWRAVIGEGN